MKVKELIEQLQGFDPESEVILQKDAEGNGYSPLEGAYGGCVYIPDTSYSGEVYEKRWTAEDADMPKAAWEALKKLPSCVVMNPMN